MRRAVKPLGGRSHNDNGLTTMAQRNMPTTVKHSVTRPASAVSFILPALLAATILDSRADATQIEIVGGQQASLSGTYDSIKVSGYAWGSPYPAITRSQLTVNAPLTLTRPYLRDDPALFVLNYGIVDMNADITAGLTSISPAGGGPSGYTTQFFMNAGTLATDLDWSGGTSFQRTGGTLALTGFNTTGADHVLEWRIGDTISGKAEFGYGATLKLLGDFWAPDLAVYAGSQIDHVAHRYHVDELTISGGGVPTSAAFKQGDEIGILRLTDYGTLTTEAGLALDQIDVRHFENEGPGLLSLADFRSRTSGVGGSTLAWGLRVAGDNRTRLTNYLAQGLVTATNNSQPVEVIYSPDLYGNYTYIGYSSVPEIDPNSFGSAFTLVLGALGLLERRARAKAA